MIIQTEELCGEALDWAVAKCVQKDALAYDTDHWISMFKSWDYYKVDLRFSKEWELAGPIIEVEHIFVMRNSKDLWVSIVHRGHPVGVVGPTPIVAAMRCLVKSKLGNEVDIPDELLSQGE